MIDVKQLQPLIDRFRDTTVLVVGDVMLDTYIWGKVSRISPEAPVPVLDVVSESQKLGGAANVIHNLHTLGGTSVICSVIGNDTEGEKLKFALQETGVSTDGLLTDPTRPTTVKTRIMAEYHHHHQQVVRLDRESREDIRQELVARLLDKITHALPSIDGVIIEDYGKGVVTGDLVQQIVSLTTQAGKIVAVDPKTHHFSRYAGVSVITPNHYEAETSLQMTINDHDSLLLAGSQLLEQLGSEFVLITRGGEGMSLFEQQSRMVTHVPAMAQAIYDVAGAGDTVIAVLTLGLAAGADPIDAMVLSNAAAGVVVGKVGIATVNPKELREALSKMNKQHVAIHREELA
jgi:D-beta-D-heptose 7-phosphate kinase/D-beta-D-heptose 1-phosphate adenosyltransferase